MIKFGVNLWVGYIKDLAFGIVSFIEKGLNGFISAFEKAFNFVKNLVFDVVDAILGVIESLVNGIIQAMLDVVSPIAGTIADIGGFASRLKETLEGSFLSLSVTRSPDISVGRVNLTGSLGLTGGNTAGVVAGGLPQFIAPQITVNVDAPNYVGTSDELASAVQRAIDTGAVSA